MRDDDRLDTSSQPSDEVKVNNIHVKEVEKWITGWLQNTGYINFNALEKAALEKEIAEKVAS
jgi:hypothetical protein